MIDDKSCSCFYCSHIACLPIDNDFNPLYYTALYLAIHCIK